MCMCREGFQPSAIRGSGCAEPTSDGDVAQLGERLVCNQEVAGSIPVVSN